MVNLTVLPAHINDYAGFPDAIARQALTFADDPVALACASWRIGQETTHRWYSLDQCEVTAADREQADQLRSYYKERTQDTLFLTLRSKNGRAVSEFRRKLHLLVTGGLHLTQQELGLLYRLPYLYQEDLGLDRVASTTQSLSTDQTRLVPEPVTKTLTPVERVFRSRKAAESVQFWWRDQHNHAHLLTVRTNNNLLSMIEQAWSRPQIEMTFLSATSVMGGYHDGHWFVHMLQPKIVAL